jgi:hypothetical protein
MAVRAVVFVVTLAVLPGCRFEVDLSDARFACADGVCPAGQTCAADGFCTPFGVDGPDGAPAAPDASDAPDAAPGTPDAAPGPDAGPCGTISLLADDFEGAAVDPQWTAIYQNGGATAVQTGGRLVMTPAAGKSGSNYAGFGTQQTYDLRGGRLFVRLVGMVNTGTTAQAYLKITDAQNGQRAFLMQEGGTLYARVEASGTTSEKSTTYAPAAHAFWAIREAGGTLFFETSTNGTAWTVFDQRPAPFDLAKVRVELGGGTYQAVASPGAAQFDDLNGGVASGTPCP